MFVFVLLYTLFSLGSLYELSSYVCLIGNAVTDLLMLLWKKHTAHEHRKQRSVLSVIPRISMNSVQSQDS